MTDKIYPCLWFDGQAKAAADFYCSIFPNSKITVESPMVVKFEIEGKTIMGLNGGPMFKINPSISLFVTCQSNEEIENIWNQLKSGGSIMMPLDKYPWSEKYGWLVDKFGMTWQLMLGELSPGAQKIAISFLFVGNQYGKAQQAIKHYTSIFHDSNIHRLEIYKEGEEQPEGNLKFGHFSLDDISFYAMDGIGEHKFQFNEGVSLVVECETQDEIDNYWKELTKEGTEVQCGWLKDKFGVSWQIVPAILDKIMSDPERAERVMQKVMTMKKLDIKTLVNA
jgi:predicted 3-demethylubiquinone-9 3-methyltransferase (glyoxalase superfamily)